MRRTSSRFSLPRELTENWVPLTLLLIFFLALTVRMVPTRYGTIMDPDAFFMYRMAGDIVEKGYYPTWDNLGWQPGGRSLSAEMPLLPYAVAYTYMLLKLMGAKMSLNAWTLIFPAIVGATSAISIFSIGRDLKDRKTGLIAALLIATMPEYLNRTMGGVTDKECLAFPLALAGFAVMFRMLKEENSERSLLEGLGAGLLFGLVSITWGGFTFLLLFFAAFYSIIILLDLVGFWRVENRTILSLVVMSLAMTLISMGIPNWRIHNPFVLIHLLATVGLLSYIGLTRLMVSRALLPRRTAVVVFLVIAALVLLFPGYGSYAGIIKFNVPRKFMILLDPFMTPKVGMHITVQEYAKPTISDLLTRYNFYPFLALARVFFSARRRRLEDLLVCLWAASGFYAGLSAIRNTMLLTPALCVLAALSVTEFMTLLSRDRALGALLRSKSKHAKDLAREIRLAKIGGPLVALALVLFLVPSVYLGIQLVQGRGPVLGQGWYDALTWLNRETSEDSIILAWWDYGHWITSVAKRRCVSDGATTNFTTIQSTAHAYLSPEDVAVKIFKKHHVEYVVVPEHDFWLAGAFAQIVGNITDFPDGYYKLNSQSGSISWNDLTPKGQNTTIYKLLFAQPDPTAKNFELVHESPGGAGYSDTTVRIYRVDYHS